MCAFYYFDQVVTLSYCFIFLEITQFFYFRGAMHLFTPYPVYSLRNLFISYVSPSLFPSELKACLFLNLVLQKLSCYIWKVKDSPLKPFYSH